MSAAETTDGIGDLWRIFIRAAKGAGVIPRFGEKLAASGYKTDEIKFFEALANDFPELRFRTGRKFAFRPPKTVVIGPAEAAAKLLFLHELGHATLKHRDFRTDTERLKMEAAAWEKARELSDKYFVQFDEDLVQAELDTYRDWLHQKSRCPKCGLTRFETPDGQYHCPKCDLF